MCIIKKQHVKKGKDLSAFEGSLLGALTPRPPEAAEYPACVPPRRLSRCSPKYLGSVLDSRPRKSLSTWLPFVAESGTATSWETRRIRTTATSWTRSTEASVVVPTSRTLQSTHGEGSLPLPRQRATRRLPHGGNDAVRRETCGRLDR